MLVIAFFAIVGACVALEGCTPCTPTIDKASVIEAVNGLRGNVAVVPDYGNCPVGNTGYTWTVTWGDGTNTTGDLTYLNPYQALHQYAAAGTYLVVASYCSACECAPCGQVCTSCSKISKVILVFNEATQSKGVEKVAAVVSKAAVRQHASMRLSKVLGLSQTCQPCLPVVDPATLIEPVVGHRANVAFLPDYGSCSVLGSGYNWRVNWDDGTFTEGDLTPLSPFQALHTYSADGVYNVSASYCSSCGCYCDPCSGETVCPSCASTWKLVYVS